MAAAGVPPEAEQVDGRTARRDRNTAAVLDAARDLFIEGNLQPTVEAVAARAGLSLRSVYRYFEDTEALFRAAIARRVALAESLFPLPQIGEGDLEDRIARVVDHRLALYEALAPEVRAALLRGPSAPLVMEAIEGRRRQLSEQVRAHFAPELGRGAAAQDVLRCVDLLLQFEALENLTQRHRHSLRTVRRILVAGLRALLVDRD